MAALSHDIIWIPRQLWRQWLDGVKASFGNPAAMESALLSLEACVTQPGVVLPEGTPGAPYGYGVFNPNVVISRFFVRDNMVAFYRANASKPAAGLLPAWRWHRSLGGAVCGEDFQESYGFVGPACEVFPTGPGIPE